MRDRLAAVSSIVGGMLFIFQGVAFAVTHGSTTYNRNEAWLGVEAVVLAQTSFVPPLVLFLALLGYGRRSKGAGRAARFGLRLAQVSSVLLSISFILQTNIVDPLTEWQSPIVMSGWLLFLLAVPLVCLGCVLWGAAARKTLSGMERTLFLAVGVCTLGALAAEFWISGRSDGSLPWEIAIGAKNVPAGAAWIGLGILASKGRSGTPHSTSVSG